MNSSKSIVYAVNENWANDGNEDSAVTLFYSKTDAIKYLNELIEEDSKDGITSRICDCINFVCDRTEDSYDCYLEGDYNTYHYTIDIEEKEVR